MKKQRPKKNNPRKKNLNKIKALYVHIPFCQELCAYCDFPKVIYDASLADSYLLSLKGELDSLSINEDLETVYVGGGTPTSLSDEQFSFLLTLLDPYTKKVKEYTFEANPESLSLEKIKLLKTHGVNRISLGVESTNDDILKAINRKHTFKTVQEATLLLRENGFDNLSFDLILGLPNVTKSMLIKDLENLISLNPEHISCYSLTVHPNTIFGIKNIPEPSDDMMRDAYDLVNSFLESHGYEHYEVSNWSKPNKESQHNLVYWKDEQYFGVGLGAASYMGNYRYLNTKSITKYNASEYTYEKEEVTLEDDKEYFIMLNLRTKYGLSFTEYEERFHEDFESKYDDVITKLINEKYLIKKDKKIFATYPGMMVLDYLILSFLTR